MTSGRVLLIAYSGYPEVNSTWLHLDNGLALLAGALLARGHQVRIKDLQTLETWEKLYPYDVKDEYTELRRAFEDYAQRRGIGAAADAPFERWRAFDEYLIRRNAGVAAALADGIAAEFADYDPHVIGFKLWSQNSFADQVLMARRLKQAFPDALFAAGGPAVELLQDAVMRYTDVFDLLVHGPGERAICDILERKTQRRTAYAELAGVIYRDGGNIVRTARKDPSLGERVLPYYGKDVYVDYDRKLHNVHVESDRGCNFLCEFCIHPHKSGRQQKKASEQFVWELAELNARYGFSYFHLAGSDPPYRHLVDICKQVTAQGHDFGFMGFQSLRVVDEEGLQHLRRANVDRLWVGIESGDTEILFDIQKGRKLGRLEKAAALVRQHGIAITGSIITPCPGDKQDSTDNTIALLEKVRPDVVLTYPPLVQPTSAWFTADGGPIVIRDRRAVEDAFVQHGMEWHPANRILPLAFHAQALDDLVQINGRRYCDIYCDYVVNRQRIIRRAAGKLAVEQFGDRSRHRSPLKRLYFKSQLAVCSAIVTGEFERAAKAVVEYNAGVLAGRYSASDRDMVSVRA